MKAKQIFYIFLSLFAAALLSGCPGAPELKINRSETFFNNLGAEPGTLNPIRSTDRSALIVHTHILESLLQRDPYTYKWKPLLAKKWAAGPDGQTFTFELFKNLKWSDNKDLTVHDVKFSFEAYKNPEYGGIHRLPYYENIESAKILSPNKIQFKAKKPYFGNFDVIAGMDIIPKHIYQNPKEKLSKTIIGSGPYVLDAYLKGKIMVLKKNPLWSGADKPFNKGLFLFPKIVLRFIKEKSDSLLRMEKGHIDFTDLTAEDFFEKTNKAPWGSKIKKVQYQNKAASGFSYIGFNFKKPLFQDKKVRRALAHLMNRRLMNKKFQYGQYELARGPWYFWSEYADPNVKPIEFNPKKALTLLKAAGWADRDKNGLLEKTIKGRKKELSFTVLFSNPSSEKYLTLYQEDLKQAGIKLNLRILDWTSFLRILDDQNFDAVMLGWTGTIEIDPKQIWHSQSARKGGSNFINYSNKKVDALIDQARKELNRKKRAAMLKKVYREIAEDAPYIFMFNTRKNFYGVNQRIKTPADALPYQVGMFYWSLKTN